MKELTHGTVSFKDLNDDDLCNYYIYLLSQQLSETIDKEHIELCFKELEKRNIARQCDDGSVRVTINPEYLSD